MLKPKVLDLYCKAGGAGTGFARSGCIVTGVDIEHQPRYPFRFIQADALEFLRAHGHEFDYVHASPPCQRDSNMTRGLWKDRVESHPDLIGPTHDLLVKIGKPYDIENVPGARAKLKDPVMLCGSMFGLKVRKHRYFETSYPVLVPTCKHKEQGRVVAVYGHSGGSSKRDGLKFGGVDTWKEAMQIDWMTGSELAEAIPPAYTEFLWSCYVKTQE